MDQSRLLSVHLLLEGLRPRGWGRVAGNPWKQEGTKSISFSKGQKKHGGRDFMVCPSKHRHKYEAS